MNKLFREWWNLTILLLAYTAFVLVHRVWLEDSLMTVEKWTLGLGITVIIIGWIVLFLLFVCLKTLSPEKRERLLTNLDDKANHVAPNETDSPKSNDSQTTNRKETSRMKGTILDFTIQTNTGIVSGDDGKRYSFVGAEWKDSAHPVKGMTVDFEPKENLATSVYVMSGGGGASIVGVGSGRKRPPEYQGFYKSKDDKMFAGVCGGLGHKWNVSPIGLRIVFVILGLIYFLGVIIYVALWIILKGVPTKNVKFDD